MIEVESHFAVIFYLLCALFLGIWIGFLHWTGRKNKKTMQTEQLLVHCEYCHFSYLGFNDKKISKCPRCQQYNTSG